MPSIKERIEKYFDCLIVDEVQDFDGWDFDYLIKLLSISKEIMLVGDFYQHTFSTSNDGSKNKNLYNDLNNYISRFKNVGVLPDRESLSGSWRCGNNICDYISSQLGISIKSNLKDNNSKVVFIESESEALKLFNDNSIVKLHYQNSSKFGLNNLNWGDSKGIDDFNNICILLNKKTMSFYKNNDMKSLPPTTLKKLYVAITRAHENVYLVDESIFFKYSKE